MARWRGLVVLALILLAACGKSHPSALAVNTGPAPWPSPDRVPDRVKAAHLPHSSVESLEVHYHSHLDIFVNGKSEPVAASIGRVDSNFFSPLHTHATSGLIHIEAAKDVPITLGNVFTEWGVRPTATCLGGYCRPA